MSDEHDLSPEHKPGQSEHTVSTRAMELVVAAALMLVAAVVMADSWRVGAGWAVDGPQAGYFPFYIGLIMFVSSAVTRFLVSTRISSADRYPSPSTSSLVNIFCDPSEYSASDSMPS